MQRRKFADSPKISPTFLDILSHTTPAGMKVSTTVAAIWPIGECISFPGNGVQSYIPPSLYMKIQPISGV